MFKKKAVITSQDFNEGYIASKHRYVNSDTQRLLEIFSLCNFSDKKIIDIGGGVGFLSHALAFKNDVTMVDFAEEAIKILREYCSGFEVYFGDFKKFFNENKDKYDVAILADVVEEIYYEDFIILLDALEEREVNHLVVSTPTHANYLKLSTHLVIYPKQELLTMFKERGWEVEEEIIYADRLMARFVKV